FFLTSLCNRLHKPTLAPSTLKHSIFKTYRMHRNHFLFFLLFVLSGHIGSAQSPRKHINLDDNWKFSFGHAANPEKDFNYSITTIFSKSGGAARTAIDPRFRDSAWRTLNLPHDWAVELPFVNIDNRDVESHGYKPVGGLFPETSIGWYRKHFTIARADSGQRFQVQFDGIFRDANIWVNGFYLGNNKSGYIGAAYDITDFVNFDRDNVLVVRADATQYEGWFYEGAGIYRHVWLNQYNNLHIAHDGVFAFSESAGNKTTIYVNTEIENQNLSTATTTVSSYCMDRSGIVISRSKEQPLTLNVNGITTIKQSVALTNPRLWTLDDPYLYRVIVELRSNGKLIDQQIFRFGIRTVEIKTNGVFLNGKHVKLFGVNNHQDHAGVG